MNKNFLDKIYGKDDIKEELHNIFNWFTDKRFYENKDIILPKGILFYGGAGCGKTLFLREYSKLFPYPVYTIDGTKEDLANYIKETFLKARKQEGAIIVIDELDTLIEFNSIVIWALKTELDGMNKLGHILVLLSANQITKIPCELRRDGRIDRLFYLGDLAVNEQKYFLAKSIENYKMKIPEKDIDILAKFLVDVNPVIIRNIIANAYLRKGKNCGVLDIQKSIDLRSNNYRMADKKERDRRIAIHEAGHVIMILVEKEFKYFYKSIYTEYGGLTSASNKKDNESFNQRIAGIMISLGGHNAEKVIYGKHDYGSARDFELAEYDCFRLISCSCYESLGDVHSAKLDYKLGLIENEKQKTRLKRKTTKLLKRYDRKTYHILKKNKSKIEYLGNLMYERGYVSYLDIPKNWNL